MSSLCSAVRAVLALTIGLLVLAVSLPTAVAQTTMPTVTNITNRFGCLSQSTFMLYDCTPGSSSIMIAGTGLYSPIAVTVAGLPCTVFNVVPGGVSLGVMLPAPESFNPGQGYDLVLTQGSVNQTTLTFPGAIAFTARPSITSVTSQYCPRDWLSTLNNYLYCGPGDVLTIIGSFFSPSTSLSVQLIPGSNSRQRMAVSCLNVNLVSVSTLTCTLPAITNATVLSAFQSYVSQIQVYENATSYSNLYSASVYISSYRPQLLSVTGCAGADPSTHGASGCVTGAVITLNGANFNQTWNPNGAFGVVIYEFEAGIPYPCQSIVMVSSTIITCRLPYIARFDDETLLPIRVQSGGQNGNWLYGVGYSNGLNYSSSTSYLSSLIACAVLLFIFVALFVLALVYIVYLRGLMNYTRKSPRHVSSEREDLAFGGGSQGPSGVELS